MEITRYYPHKNKHEGIILITSRNTKVDEIIKEIKKIKYWNDYLFFENERYGIPFVFNNKHRENDCFGNIKRISVDSIYKYVCDRCFSDLLFCIDNIYLLFLDYNIPIEIFRECICREYVERYFPF